jgi:sterol 3beta-glucosyltransferase
MMMHRKVIFKAQNMGESVQIAIPYSTILEVDRSHAMDFSDTLEVKVVDNQDNCLIESYFFAYFNSMDDVLKQINEAISVSHLDPATTRPPILKDTTHRRPDTLPQIHEETSKISTNSMPEPVNKSGFRFPSILRSLGSKDDHIDHSAGVLSLGGSSVQTSEPQQINTHSGEISNNVILADSAASSSISSFDHTYPPSPSPPGSEIVHPSDSQNSSWSVSVPSWLKGSSLKIFTGASSRTMTETAGGVSETYTQRFVATPEELEEDHEFDIVESNLSSKHGIDLQVEEKFRRTFAVDDKEELLGRMFHVITFWVQLFTFKNADVQGYILRVLPVYGRFYISTRYLSFRSSQSLIKTRVDHALKVTHYCTDMIPR